MLFHQHSFLDFVDYVVGTNGLLVTIYMGMLHHDFSSYEFKMTSK